MSDQSLADYLRFYRLRAALTQGELAERTGVSVRAIRDLERGRALTPHARSLRLLAGGLDLADSEAAQLLALGTGNRTEPAAEVRDEGEFAFPSAPTGFVGRQSELRWVLEQAEAAGDAVGTRAGVVHGPPGMGKTSLVLTAAHRLREHFPDGCHFVDLGGMSRDPLSAEQAAGRLLRSLGVQVRALPTDPAELFGHYRSLLRERSVLLVLDNAGDAAQVRPLLAASAGSFVLVTSRNVLPGLDGAQRLDLGLMDQEAAVQVLTGIVGEQRCASESAAVAEVARLCERVPLALRIAGTRLASRPEWSITGFAEQLADNANTLSLLSAGHLQVRAAFELSHRQLSPEAAVMFRRLALAPGRDVGLDLAARLAEQSTATADVALSELADASLVRPGGEPDRYSFHDLLLLFAGEKLAASSDDVEACRELMVRWLLTKAITASRFFHPDDEPLADDVAVFGDLGAAERWLDREADSWLGALRLAVARERHADVLELAHAMHWYSDHRGASETWLEVFGAGLDAARVVGTAHDVAVQLNFVTWTLGFAFLRYRDALLVGEEAIALTERENDVIELAWAHLYRSVLKGFLKDLDDAVISGQRALELFQSAGYETGVTIACNAFGDALVAAGRVEDGLRCQREAIAKHLAVIGPRGGSSDDNLASIYLSHSDTLLRAGKVGEAGRAIDQAERFLGTGSVWGRASSHHMRGKYLLASGHDEKAYDELSVAMELVKSTSRRVQLLTMLADLAEKLGRSEEAREHRVRGVALLGRPDLTLNRAETAEIAAALGVPLEVFVN